MTEIESLQRQFNTDGPFRQAVEQHIAGVVARFQKPGAKAPPGVVMDLLKNKTSGDDPGGGGGGGGTSGGGGHSGGGRTTSGGGTSGSTSSVPKPFVETFFWGYHWVFPHEFIEQGATGFDLAAIFTGAIGVVSGPAAPFVELVAAYLKAEGALVRAVDQGKGAYVSMTWLAPGIFVPTAIT